MLTGTRSLDLTKQMLIKDRNIRLKPVKLLFDGICEIFAKIHWMDQQFMLERNMVKHSKNNTFIREYSYQIFFQHINYSSSESDTSISSISGRGYRNIAASPVKLDSWTPDG